jgi:MarR family transcriptional regulator for hemolysin
MIEGEGQLLQLLTDTQIAMSRLFAHRAQHLGLTRPQWRVLATLYNDQGTTQSQLAERTSIARSPLGKIIDQLERRGYVERRDDPDDRRVNRLYTTPAVEPLVEPARSLSRELEHAVLEGVPRKGELVSLLANLKSKLEELAAQEVQTA